MKKYLKKYIKIGDICIFATLILLLCKNVVNIPVLICFIPLIICASIFVVLFIVIFSLVYFAGMELDEALSRIQEETMSG